MLSEPLYPPSVTQSKFPYQITRIPSMVAYQVGYKKSSSTIYAHF